VVVCPGASRNGDLFRKHLQAVAVKNEALREWRGNEVSVAIVDDFCVLDAEVWPRLLFHFKDFICTKSWSGGLTAVLRGDVGTGQLIFIDEKLFVFATTTQLRALVLDKVVTCTMAAFPMVRLKIHLLCSTCKEQTSVLGRNLRTARRKKRLWCSADCSADCGEGVYLTTDEGLIAVASRLEKL